MSFERLEALASAKKRQRAIRTLDLAQAVVAGLCDEKGWAEKQKKLISESRIGL